MPVTKRGIMYRINLEQACKGAYTNPNFTAVTTDPLVYVYVYVYIRFEFGASYPYSDRYTSSVVVSTFGADTATEEGRACEWTVSRSTYRSRKCEKQK